MSCVWLKVSQGACSCQMEGAEGLTVPVKACSAALLWAEAVLLCSLTWAHTCLSSSQCPLMACLRPPTPAALAPEGYACYFSLCPQYTRALATPTAPASGLCKRPAGVVSKGRTSLLCTGSFHSCRQWALACLLARSLARAMPSVSQWVLVLARQVKQAPNYTDTKHLECFVWSFMFVGALAKIPESVPLQHPASS